MKKPSPKAIRETTPLSARAARGSDPILVCNVCGEPGTLGVWREHDERDRPIAGVGALVYVGTDAAHDMCRALLDEHPRLYAEDPASPGAFPNLCGPCVHRRGLICDHPDLKANGGPGLRVTLDTQLPGGVVCIRGARRPPPRALSCVGRTEAS